MKLVLTMQSVIEIDDSEFYTVAAKQIEEDGVADVDSVFVEMYENGKIEIDLFDIEVFDGMRDISLEEVRQHIEKEAITTPKKKID